jgi:hypothetical protein
MMRRIRLGLIAAVVALGAVSWSTAPAAAGTAAPAVSYYLSLGDSLAQGVQPEPEPDGPNTPTKQGYPDQPRRRHQVRFIEGRVDPRTLG